MLSRHRSKSLRVFVLVAMGTFVFAPTLQNVQHPTSAYKPPVAWAGIRRAEAVYVGGQSIGIRLNSKGVLVVGFEHVEDSDSPAKAGHIQVGDVIETINGQRIHSISELREHVMKASEHTLDFVVHRGEAKVHVQVRPTVDSSGNKRLGLLVRDSTRGVGTLTFYDAASHRYGALGHVITDADTGHAIDGWGTVYDSEIFGIVRGSSGKPGEKRGRFVTPQIRLGSIDSNTAFGVFGSMKHVPPHLYRARKIPVARPNQVHNGEATILTVVHGQQVEPFTVRIENKTRQTKPTTKSMIVHVTDPRLLKETGGIVQGMSGSPILQDGRLIGAVTHVFVSDPTRGYGVYAKWMLEQAHHRTGALSSEVKAN
ncbi:SpoIVB peptidase [Alicyclobacillus sp. SO9]|uniref:SpoIVB peptidase n=1 Tax=Alicyclobacillus sp. SO9 TaxID=2665646 RepID=UPI0018E839AB|nr:SpoIVB peptidase [Alicyclobacillus sp. SO9]QQE76961.1 SpoIVB peptidase [Alicyclobacillus sp. SO9]